MLVESTVGFVGLASSVSVVLCWEVRGCGKGFSTDCRRSLGAWEPDLSQEKTQPAKSRKLPNVYSALSPYRSEKVIDTQEALMVMRYSPNTIRSYLSHLRLFFSRCKNFTAEEIDTNKIRKYILWKAERGSLGTATQHQLLNALKFWFERLSGGRNFLSSVQKIFRRAKESSKINPFATVHTLRHSYATHLLEQRFSLRHIQLLLGRSSSKTTEIHTLVSTMERRSILSPLDSILHKTDKVQSRTRG